MTFADTHPPTTRRGRLLLALLGAVLTGLGAILVAAVHSLSSDPAVVARDPTAGPSHGRVCNVS